MAAVTSYQAHKRIGESIRYFRHQRGMTQEQLAEEADLHPVYISQIERADRAVTIETLLRLAKVLGVKLKDVIGDM